MTKAYFLVFFVALAGCSGGFQKSLTSDAGYSDFRSALHIAGETPVSRTVVQIVALEGDEAKFGLITHVGRLDGRFPGISQARADGATLQYRRLTSSNTQFMQTESGLISIPSRAFSLAARQGLTINLCGSDTCYEANIPAGLFLQAIIE